VRETSGIEIRLPPFFVEFMPEFDSHAGPSDRSAPPTAGRAGASEDAVQDAVIVRRMADGDESALGALYDRWADAVNALVERIVRDEAEAEEVVEAVFWQAWQQAGRYTSDRGAPGAWLLAMARSRSLDRLRALRRRRDDQPADDSIFQNQPAVGDPLSDLDANERAGRVVSALQLLPLEQREVLELAYFEGLSQTEIAERLAVPLGTVKTRARLALRKMRDRLDALREVEA
jgi:RNA polymerase sigma-70 factor, ECF subfamily